MVQDNPIRTSVEQIITEGRLDCLWVKDLPSIKYLTGFTGSTANLLIGEDERTQLNVDSRYTTQAKAECRVDRVVEITRPIEDLSKAVLERGVKRLGFECGNVTFAEHRNLVENLPGVELVPVEVNLAALRLIKNAEQVETLRDANRRAQKAFAEFVQKLHVGWREDEAAWYLEQRFRENGATGLSFDTLVCSGPRAAIVHGKPTDRKMEKGDFVIVDRGMMYHHYATDETSTFVLGKADARQKTIYQTVKDAHDRAIEAIKPGVACKDIDAVARQYIHDQGFGEYFGHGTGHGVGIEVHEMPHISPRGEGYVEEGMVFSIEPGIYIPEYGGVRIEDVVLVTRDGCEILTLSDKTTFELDV
jgi:Xaa-Pro aminopeptidase